VKRLIAPLTEQITALQKKIDELSEKDKKDV
jgi:hypothetical protein